MAGDAWPGVERAAASERHVGGRRLWFGGESAMSTIAVELPEDLREFIETKVQRGEFASVSEYIVALVNAARRSKSDIEAALLEGLESGPAQEWTRQEWSDIKQRVMARHSEVDR
jgi:putative addiction module CopG family antidote